MRNRHVKKAFERDLNLSTVATVSSMNIFPAVSDSLPPNTEADPANVIRFCISFSNSTFCVAA